MHITNNLDPYECKKGKWKRRNKWRNICFAIFVLGLTGAYIGHIHTRSAKAHSLVVSSGEQGNGSVRSSDERQIGETDCVKIETGYYNCASKENLAKWNEWLESEVEELKVEAGKPTAILTKVCRTNGITDSNCPKILYAMALQESGMGKWMEGDHGKSHGFFHILDIHGVSKSCVNDLFCSADWSMKRMIRLGFNENRDNAIRLHNGGLNNPLTLAYLQAVKKKMALWPNG